MQVAPWHHDEEERLQQLRDLDVLDTGQDPAWDRLAALAAHICGTPIALVSLVDRERQWFKARVGLEASQTHRDAAFCAHAILQDEILHVPNARKDDRFRDNPLVTGAPKIRAYAGAPVRGPRGAPMGTLCVIDTKPRRLDVGQMTALRWLADQAEELFRYRAAGLKMLRILEDPAFDEVDPVAKHSVRAVADLLASSIHQNHPA